PAPTGNGMQAPVVPQDVPAPVPAAAVPPVTPPAPVANAPAGEPNATNPPGLMPLPSVGTRSEPVAATAAGTRAPSFGGTAAPIARVDLPPVQHVRDAQVALDFDLEQTGPSGVKKIEVYMTDDDGQTWKPWIETYEVKSPLQIPLPPPP